jgi:parallel beta-helix repeat protein
MTGNSFSGVLLIYYSSNNTVLGNNITAAVLLFGGGVCLSNSFNNSISENSIANNEYGVGLYNASNNRFFHNNFINNTENVYNWYEMSINTWDDGYPSGGNFWSDYTTRYPSALEIDDSSIWDTPYVLDTYNQDNYSLMGPWTPKGENVTVTPEPGVSITFANVMSGGITTVNETQSGPSPPVGFKIEEQYLDIQTTASYSGNITIRMIYDDFDMTLEEEESLQLMRWNETTQQWEDITKHVDMENNVICGETSHLSIFGVHSQLIHDLSIFSVHLAKTVIGQGYTLRIDVGVRNEGDFAEDFDVTLDLIGGEVGHLSIFGVHILEESTTTLTFEWNTVGFAKGAYSVTAHVSQVPYEINVSDNTCTDGTAKVTIPGDITGDFYVSIQDATQIGLYWQQTSPPAPAIVDINGDGIISIKDATLVGLNWLQHA